MSLLQKMFNVTNCVVVDMDARMQKNDTKFWARVGKGTLGDSLGEQALGFISVFAPAKYCYIGESVLKGAFYAARGATMSIAKKSNKTLDLSKLPSPKPPRWQPPRQD